MKLKDFIKETLVEIAEAIREAKDAASDKISISPGFMEGKKVIEVSYVEFDIAVTANETSHKEKDAEGGLDAKIEVLGIKSGLKAGASTISSTQHQKEEVSRIQFKVPVYFGATSKNLADRSKETESLKKTDMNIRR